MPLNALAFLQIIQNCFGSHRSFPSLSSDSHLVIREYRNIPSSNMLTPQPVGHFLQRILLNFLISNGYENIFSHIIINRWTLAWSCLVSSESQCFSKFICGREITLMYHIYDVLNSNLSSFVTNIC